MKTNHMKTSLIPFTLLFSAACLDVGVQAVPVRPIWDTGDVAEWATTVQAAIDTWQATLGEDCEFPIKIIDYGRPVALVDQAHWAWPGNEGLTNSAYVLVSGERPDGHGVPYILMHEFGHVVGLVHTDQLGSIMYKYDSLDPRAAKVPTSIDRDAFQGCARVSS